VTGAGDKASILSAITTLKSPLADYIEPDFGLLNELLRLHVLTRRQANDVRSQRTVFRKNDALLDLLTSEEQCVKFVTALQRTGQHHVVNFITQNGGQKHNLIVTYLVNLLYVKEHLLPVIPVDSNYDLPPDPTSSFLVAEQSSAVEPFQ